MDAFQILVVFLAVFLAVFLVLGIILLVMSIRISMKIRDITDDVEEAAGSLRDLLVTLNQLANPAVAAKIAVKYIRSYINKKKEVTR